MTTSSASPEAAQRRPRVGRAGLVDPPAGRGVQQRHRGPTLPAPPRSADDRRELLPRAPAARRARRPAGRRAASSARTSRPARSHSSSAGGDVPALHAALVVGVVAARPPSTRGRAPRCRRGGCRAPAAAARRPAAPARARTRGLVAEAGRDERRREVRRAPTRASGSPSSVGGRPSATREALAARRVEDHADARRALAGDRHATTAGCRTGS